MLILTIDKVSNNESLSLKVIPADCSTLFETLCVMTVRVDLLIQSSHAHIADTHPPFAQISCLRGGANHKNAGWL